MLTLSVVNWIWGAASWAVVTLCSDSLAKLTTFFRDLTQGTPRLVIGTVPRGDIAC